MPIRLTPATIRPWYRIHISNLYKMDAPNGIQNAMVTPIVGLRSTVLPNGRGIPI